MTDEFDRNGTPINITVSHQHYWDLRQEIIHYKMKIIDMEDKLKKIKRGILCISEDIKELLT